MRVFYIAMTIFIPLLMLFIGWMMKKHPPKNINDFIGYWTKRSMRSQETWNFAHQYCGKICMLWGLISLIGSIFACVIYFGAAKKCYNMVMLFAELTQVLLLFVSIFPTEHALQKNFDSNGDRKTNEVK